MVQLGTNRGGVHLCDHSHFRNTNEARRYAIICRCTVTIPRRQIDTEIIDPKEQRDTSHSKNVRYAIDVYSSLSATEVRSTVRDCPVHAITRIENGAEPPFRSMNFDSARCIILFSYVFRAPSICFASREWMLRRDGIRRGTVRFGVCI